MQNAERPDPFIEDESGSRVSLFPNLYVTGIGIEFEQQARDAGYRFIAGVDEVGRGCLAGPVVAAACILDLDRELPEGLDDSKKLTEKTRDEVAHELKQVAVAYAIGQVEADEIDRINILEATKEAMLNAIASLAVPADFILVDALHLKQLSLPQRAIIKGDTVSASIAAASIIAKTYRDALMTGYAAEYPEYGFEGHKGYGAVSHFEALKKHGPCILHRKSFRGVIQ